MNTWANPNHNILRIRLTEKKYADAFMKRGCIKFNTPESWEKYEKANGAGRGDAYEGTLGFCHYLDIKKASELDKKYSLSTNSKTHSREVIKKKYNQRILFKDKRSMNLPCFCLYMIKVDSFFPPKKAGVRYLKMSIPGSYFKDFVDNKTEDEIKKLPKESQPALIVINDFEKFITRLKKKLYNLGVQENEILIDYIKYLNFEKYGSNGWIDFGTEFPKELFIKNLRFENQREGRIIVNTNKKNILDTLSKPIDLGAMSDIATMVSGYYPEGLEAQVKALINYKE